MPVDADAHPGPARPSRRALIGGALWTTPVILGLTATPAFAASSKVVDELQIDPYELSAQGDKGTGPLYWAGGHIAWYNTTSALTTVSFVYSVTLLKPDGGSETLVPPTAGSFGLGGSLSIAGQSWGTTGSPPGPYTVTLTVMVDTDSRSVSEGPLVVAAAP